MIWLSHSHSFQETAARMSRVFSKTEPMQSATQRYPKMHPSHRHTLQECLSQGTTNQDSYLGFRFSNAAEPDSFRGTEYQPTATWGWIQLSILTTLSTCAKAFKPQKYCESRFWGLSVQGLPTTFSSLVLSASGFFVLFF